jgi:pimeloyl-ACP methyl ester carboxylesterase
MSDSYHTFTVTVDGGDLHVGRWGDGRRVVMASHGITANHLSWQRVGELVMERSGGAVSLVAIDHRGRAGSATVAGPYGLARHADDLMVVLDHLGADRAVFAGHSMGGFVVSTAAERHSARVEALVMVDGGLPFPLELPPDADVEVVVKSVIGPALDRLDQRWPDIESYIDFFVQHPSFQPPNVFPLTARAYVTHDAVADDDGRIRSSVSKAAVLEDGGAVIVDPASARAIERVNTPTTLLWAPRGMLDQSPGLYPPASIDAANEVLAHVCPAVVDDTNHYTIVVSEHGASAVADAILAANG